MSNHRHLRVVRTDEERARDAQDSLEHANPDVDAEARRAAAEMANGTERMSLPVEWVDGATGRGFQGRRAQIHQPSPSEIENFAVPPRNICGTCLHFDLKNGRREIVKQRFAERLVREDQWKLEHLGVPFDKVGLCGQSNGELATTMVSPGCDNYRDRNGRI